MNSDSIARLVLMIEPATENILGLEAVLILGLERMKLESVVTQLSSRANKKFGSAVEVD